jgi:arylsulfatase
LNDSPVNRRHFLQVAGVTAGVSLLSCSTALPTIGPLNKRINVLFIMDDQHRGDCLGADGATWLKTPNLDRLAAEGARFPKAYTSLPSCLPARATLLTGKSPWAHGMLGYTAIPQKYENEKPRMFTNDGYRTHAVGKMHFGDHKHGYQSIVLEEAWRRVTGEKFRCDYRKWFEKNYPDKDVDATGLGYTDHRGRRFWPYDEATHPTTWTADRAIDFLETSQDDKPWFLKVSFKRPHPPFDPPRRWMQYYQQVEIPMPKVGKWAQAWHGNVKGSLEKSPSATRGIFPNNEIRDSRIAYYASISHVDEQIGRLIAALKKKGELENTLVLFTTDHGDMMGDNNLWRKCYAYEPSARIPMIIRWPNSMKLKAKRGQVIDNLVELRDVLPTFLDTAGIDKPPAMDGASMLDLIRRKTVQWRKVLDLEHSQIYWKGNAWIALTDGRYKYIYFTTSGRQQLFDLDNDPYELNDLSADPQHTDLLIEWRKRMVQHVSIRGAHWVRDGDLVVQKKSILRGTHFPKA